MENGLYLVWKDKDSDKNFQNFFFFGNCLVMEIKELYSVQVFLDKVG